MKEPQILQLRSTIFINSNELGYNAHLTEKLKEISDKNSLSLSPISQFNMGGVPRLIDNGPWQLINADNSLRIIFTNGKVDIIQVCAKSQSSVEIDFIDRTKDIFKGILEKLDSKVKRMAFAPNLVYEEGPDFSIESFNKKVIKISSFGKSDAENIELSNVFRVDENLGDDKKLKVNYLVKITQGGKIEDNGKIVRCLLVNLDINTCPLSTQETFECETFRSFFDYVISWKENILNLYFEE